MVSCIQRLISICHYHLSNIRVGNMSWKHHIETSFRTMESTFGKDTPLIFSFFEAQSITPRAKYTIKSFLPTAREGSVNHSIHGRGGGVVDFPAWPAGSACRWGVRLVGGLHPGGSTFRGVCIQGVCIWGVCIQGVCMHQGGASRGVGQTPQLMTSSGGHCSGQYASYLNAFLFHLSSSKIIETKKCLIDMFPTVNSNTLYIPKHG